MVKFIVRLDRQGFKRVLDVCGPSGQRTKMKTKSWYCDLLFGLYPSSLCFLKPLRFKGWFFPRPQVKPTLLGPVDRPSLYQWTIDRSNTAPLSKTFRDELNEIKFMVGWTQKFVLLNSFSDARKGMCKWGL
jgi:hypothetical protein